MESFPGGDPGPGGAIGDPTQKPAPGMPGEPEGLASDIGPPGAEGVVEESMATEGPPPDGEVPMIEPEVEDVKAEDLPIRSEKTGTDADRPSRPAPTRPEEVRHDPEQGRDRGTPVHIESPDSIANNYSLSEKDGFITAYSRTNHRTTPQELRVDEFMDGIHPKQRGIVVTEKKLENGKTLYVAERPSSKSKRDEQETSRRTRQDDAPPPEPADGEKKKEKPKKEKADRSKEKDASKPKPSDKESEDSEEKEKKKPSPILQQMDDFDLAKHEKEHIQKFKKHFQPHLGDRVYYERDADGNTQLGLRFDEKHESYVNWENIFQNWERVFADHEGKGAPPPEEMFAVIKASSQKGKYTGYIHNGMLYEIIRKPSTDPNAEDEIQVLPPQQLQQLPNMMIGQDFGREFKLDSVEIAGIKAGYGSTHEIFSTMDTPNGGNRYNHHGGQNPFIEAGATIAQIRSGAVDFAEIEPPERTGNGMRWQELLKQHARPKEKKAATTRDRAENMPDPDELQAKIGELVKKFEDKTYVPSIKELTEMQRLAEHVTVSDYRDDRPVYTLADGTELPFDQTNTFIKNARNSRWMLSDHQEDVYLRARQKKSFAAILGDPSFKGPARDRQGLVMESSILTAEEFRREMKAKREEEDEDRSAGLEEGGYESAGLKEQERWKTEDGRLYKEYLAARIALSRGIKKRTDRNHDLRQDKNTDSPAVNIYSALSAERLRQEREKEIKAKINREKEDNRLSRRAGRKIDERFQGVFDRGARVGDSFKRRVDNTQDRISRIPQNVDRGLDAVHRTNMEIDAAVRRGMDRTVTRASRVRTGRRRRSGR